MAQFKSTVTDKGVLMMTQALAESKKITITRVEIGDGKYLGAHNTLTALVNKVNIYSGISGKAFIEDIMRVTVQIRNEGLITPVYVREIGLIARIEGSNTDVLFGYAWLSGVDSDNVVPVPVTPNFPDTFHQYEIGIRILNQIQALIQVQFAFDSFVTFEEMETFIENFVTQIMDNPLLISISDRIGYPTDTASPTGNTLFKLIKWIVDRFTTHWTDARAAKIDTIDTKTGTINTNVTTINTNVSTINGKIGTNTDAAGTSTVFAWMSRLWGEVSKIAGLKTVTDATKVVADNIYTYLTTNMSASRMAKIDAIESKLNSIKTVKRILRGTAIFQYDSAYSRYFSSITINLGTTIVPENTIIMFEGNCGRNLNGIGGEYMLVPYLSNITSTSFTAGSAGEPGAPITFSWTLVEYT